MSFRNIIVLIFTTLVIILTWPIFAAWMPTFEKSWRWYPICILIGIILAKNYFHSKQFFFLLWYGFVLYLNSILGDNYLGDSSGILALTRTGALLITSSAPFIIVNYNIRKFFYVVFIFLLIFTSIATFYFNLSFPDVVRNDPTITGLSGFYEFSYLYRFGHW